MKRSRRHADPLPEHPDAPPRTHPRSDDGNAFFPDPADGPALVKDDLAQELAEEFLIAATSGEEIGEEAFNQGVPEDGLELAPPPLPEFEFGDPDGPPITARPTAGDQQGPTSI